MGNREGGRGGIPRNRTGIKRLRRQRRRACCCLFFFCGAAASTSLWASSTWGLPPPPPLLLLLLCPLPSGRGMNSPLNSVKLSRGRKMSSLGAAAAAAAPGEESERRRRRKNKAKQKQKRQCSQARTLQALIDAAIFGPRRLARSPPALALSFVPCLSCLFECFYVLSLGVFFLFLFFFDSVCLSIFGPPAWTASSAVFFSFGIAAQPGMRRPPEPAASGAVDRGSSSCGAGRMWLWTRAAGAEETAAAIWSVLSSLLRPFPRPEVPPQSCTHRSLAFPDRARADGPRLGARRCGGRWS